MIAAYIRVSTRQQAHEGQRDAIERAAAARGEAIDAWFEETIGGQHGRRPELDRLRVDAHRFSKLYVFRLDRLSRGGVTETLRIIKEFRDSGCAVTSVCEHFQFDGPMGELVLAVMAWAAQQERRALKERLDAAREQTLARGGQWGRPKTLREDTLRLARKMIEAGSHTVRSAAKELGVSKSTLARALSQKPGDPLRYLPEKKTG